MVMRRALSSARRLRSFNEATRCRPYFTISPIIKTSAGAKPGGVSCAARTASSAAPPAAAVSAKTRSTSCFARSLLAIASVKFGPLNIAQSTISDNPSRCSIMAPNLSTRWMMLAYTAATLA
eukprot:CAMPEP_0194556392 /NCGR_PEP_ID=MMETSP0253-20130528/98719_1 /TAXON_ID=2966 /ORGANISM="Noctiluca scintillans" /LENGTH=121 /DNA_ID=CAMNT_0039403895 /DNA_START=386 /DNA_END=751 /DNA_ORIENTATION=+